MSPAATSVRLPAPTHVLSFETRCAPREGGRGVATCSKCRLCTICLPEGLETEAMADWEGVVASRRRLGKGERLFRSGDRFTTLYAIRLGSFKTVLLAPNGSEQVAGYHLPGETLGADGLSAGAHDGEAVALEDSEVCAIYFDRLRQAARHQETIEHNLYRALATEIVRERRVMMMLGLMSG